MNKISQLRAHSSARVRVW